jgi:hypothetical protein
VTPQLRASHADRDLAVDILCAAAGDGRLTAAELDERLETALTARTIGELAAVTADLPGGELRQAAGQQVTWNTPRSEVWLPGQAPVTREDTAANDGDLTASRWAVLRSLLNTQVSAGEAGLDT